MQDAIFTLRHLSKQGIEHQQDKHHVCIDQERMHLIWSIDRGATHLVSFTRLWNTMRDTVVF